MPSGKEVGNQYVQSVLDYLDHTVELPVAADGTLNITEMAELTGVPRQSFYKNPTIRAAVEKAREARGIPARAVADKPASATEGSSKAAQVDDRNAKKTKALERRLMQVEQQNAALIAENAELRRQIKKLHLQNGREDMMIETGRRVPVTPDELRG